VLFLGAVSKCEDGSRWWSGGWVGERGPTLWACREKCWTVLPDCLLVPAACCWQLCWYFPHATGSSVGALAIMAAGACSRALTLPCAVDASGPFSAAMVRHRRVVGRNQVCGVWGQHEGIMADAGGTFIRTLFPRTS
jgi:hypothetical protein